MTQTYGVLWEQYNLTGRTKLWLALLVAVAVILIVAWPTVVGAFSGLGGYISEETLGSGTSSVMTLGSTAEGPMVLGSAPSVTTLEAQNLSAGGGGTATLRGNLTSLNGAPRADVWFAWGYAPGSLTNSTAAVSVTTTGVKTQTLTGFNTEQEVYYQFRGGTDATGYGTTLSFRIGGGLGAWLILNIVTLAMAAGVLIVAVRVMPTSPTAALVLIVIGLVAIIIVRDLIQSIL